MNREKTLKRIDFILGAAMAGILLVLATTTILLCVVYGQTSNASPSVTTPSGRYEGIVKTLPSNRSVERYAGIPFALPPVGHRRFQPPQPVFTENSEKIIDSRKLQKSCWSITKRADSPYYSEDCLYLNVYVPTIPTDDKKQREPLPVMIWLHGGGFVAGSVFPEPWLFVDQGQVIVVTLNYRLGVFGFLTTGADPLPANNGLWDQLLAMEWVKRNIAFFGGDSNYITLFGESAGATSAALHAISPKSKNLFNNAIFQSGAASSLLTRNPTEIAREFGQKVGCPSILDVEQFASCLRNLSVEAIQNFSKSISLSPGRRQIDFMWMPVIDGKLIPDEPATLLNNRTYLNSIDAFEKNFLFGVNNNEGSLLTDNFLNPISHKTVEDISFFRDLVSFVLSMRYNVHQEKLRNSTVDYVISFYTGLPIPDAPDYQSVADFFADGIFYAPATFMATSLSNCYIGSSIICRGPNSTQSLESQICRHSIGRSFLYYFDYCPPGQDSSCQETCMHHGLDVSYQFPRRHFNDKSDQLISEMFIDMISTFAKTSHPETKSFEFTAFEDSNEKYLRLSPSNPVTRRHLNRYRMKLWINTIPKLIEEDINF